MSALNKSDLALLQKLVGRLIPASAEFEMPGADDAAIFAELVAGLQSRADLLGGLLADLARRNADRAEPDPFDEMIGALRETHAGAFALLLTALAQTYYRDGRVMHALGMEPRAPFPKGFDLDEGEWSLLEEVRKSGRLWREVG